MENTLARELKPCPFCGAAGDMLRVCDTTPAGGCWISCDTCECEGPPSQVRKNPDGAAEAWNTRLSPEGEVERLREEVLNDIALMMSEFVDNWPQPKRIGTALALIAKAFRFALDPPKHKYWGAGEDDCPREIKAGNGELHTLRCKVCGEDSPRDDRCRAALTSSTPSRDRANG